MDLFKKSLVLVLVALTAYLAADSGEYGVKDAGGGLAYTAMAEDAASVFMNPAAAAGLNSHCFTASYSRLAWGIGGASIERGLGSYVYRKKGLGGLAFGFSILNQDVSYYSRLALTVAPEFRIFRRVFSIGLTGTWYQTGYRLSEFEGHDSGLDPIFEEGQTANAFGLNAGVRGNLFDKFWLGIAVRDINQPNLALQDTVGYGKRPTEFQIGTFYYLDKYFQPSLDFYWRNETINDEQTARIRVGVESSLPRGLKVRAGYDGTGIDAGLTLHSGSLFGGLDLDYAFVYPIESDLAEVGAYSHHFGLSVWAIPEREILVDLVADNLESYHALVQNGSGKIVGQIDNLGSERSEGFSVSLMYKNSEGKWKMIYPVKYLDGLAPDSTTLLEWNWKPKEIGEFLLRMVVDDDGRKAPEINGVIDEKNEKNNSIEMLADVKAPGKLNITIDTHRGFLTRLEYLREERPLLPVIFYEPGKTNLDSEEKELLAIYADRLRKNPDAIMNITGFFDPSDAVECTSGAELAVKRAEIVRDYILKQNSELATQIIIKNEIFCAEPIYRIDPAKIRSESESVAQENRRTELSVSFPAIDQDLIKYELQPDQTDPVGDVNLTEKVVKILGRNQDALIISQGGFAEGEDSLMGLKRAESLRQIIEKNNSSILPGKIRIAPAWQGATVEAKLTGEGILWAPTVSEPTVVGYENLDPQQNGIHITKEGFDNIEIDSSCVKIVTLGGDQVRILEQSEGLPSENLEWDWKNDGGNLIMPEDKFRVQAEVFIGSTPLIFRSEGHDGATSLRVKNIQRRIRKILVVQFVFDETNPSSKFLESRLDGLAASIITEARGKLNPKLVLEGHTDIIGNPEHNEKLSRKRALRELAILRLYMMNHLGMDKAADLGEWMNENNAEIDAIGYGANNPYTLHSVNPDGVPIVIGDNETPRGRTINRRVTVRHARDEDPPFNIE